VIREGAYADIPLVDGNPMDDISILGDNGRNTPKKAAATKATGGEPVNSAMRTPGVPRLFPDSRYKESVEPVILSFRVTRLIIGVMFLIMSIAGSIR